MAKILNDEYAIVPIDSVKAHPRNANSGDIGAIHTSIEANEFYGAIVVQRSTGYVLAGNHRLAAARMAGMVEIPATFVEVDDEQAVRILLADNRTASLASRDDSSLAALLKELQQSPTGLLGSGYDGDDLENLLFDIANAYDPTGGGGDPEPTAADEAQAKWQVALGDTWSGDGVTITCGDAIAPAAYERMSGIADILWTDPPYGVGYVGGTSDPRDTKNYRSGDGLKNDSLKPAELGDLLNAAFDMAWEHISPGASWYVAGPPGPLQEVFIQVLAKRGVRQGLVWKKSAAVFGRSDYHYQHEPILYGWKPGAAHTWTGDRTQTSVLEFDRPGPSDKSHPTMKPVGLVKQCLANHATPDALVLDPFCGSGTTLLAAYQLGLRVHGIELEPKFVAVSLQRLADVGVTMMRDPF